MFIYLLIVQNLQLVFSFNEETQSTLTNPVQEYQLIECVEEDQCEKCSFIQMNEIKQCQVSRQIQKMICYYQLGDDEQIQYPQLDYKACNLHKIGILSFEFCVVGFIFIVTLISWFIVSKEKDENERKLLYKIIRS